MAGTRRSLPRNSIVSIKSAIQSVARFRWLVFLIGNLANFCVFVVNTSLSLTVVAMIKHKTEENQTISALNSTLETSDVSIQPISSFYSSLWFTPTPSDGKFYVDWTNTDKDRMLQASFWGVLVMSAFGGRLCEWFGPRKTLTLALFLTGSFNLMFPTVARRSFVGAYVIRILQGMLQGVIQPSSFVIVSRWSTADERTLASAVVTSGGTLGNLVAFPLAGLLVSGTFLGGWPAVFYILGILNLIVSVIWYLMIYDTPEEHPRLSPEELEEILTKRSLKSGDRVQVPWRQIFTSLPVYAYLIPQFTYGWVVAVFASQIPSFYEEVLEFSHEANGFVASLPWLVSTMTSLVGSTIADKIRRTNRFSLSIIRKAFTVIGLGAVSIGLFIITTLGKRRIAAVLTLGMSKGMGTFCVAGSNANHLDIAPTFAGTIAGFGVMLQSIASLSANEGVARIVGENPTAENWYRFFYISSAINACGVILFCLLGSGETQKWDPSSVRRQSVKSVASSKSRKFSTKSEISSSSHHQPSQLPSSPDHKRPHQNSHPPQTQHPACQTDQQTNNHHVTVAIVGDEFKE